MKKLYEIKNRFNGEIIFSIETTSIKIAVKKAIDSGADLSWANLSGANLSGANLDFSTGFTFRCSCFNIKAELRLAAQLAYHFCRFDFSECKEAQEAQKALQDLANKFHRVEECGKIEFKEEK